MGDFAVDRWKLDGHLHVWRFPGQPTGLEGWHLNADGTACQSLANLIDSMLAANWKTRKRIAVTVPQRMIVGGGNAWKSANTLLLDYRQGEVDSDHWLLGVSEEATGVTVSLSVGDAKIRELRQSLLGLPNWRDDFAIGPEADWTRTNNRAERTKFLQECLWFWTRVA